MSERVASVPGSMSGMTRPAVNVWVFRDADGRCFRGEDYGPGRVWVQDLHHPTGLGWWAHRESVPAGPRLPVAPQKESAP